METPRPCRCLLKELDEAAYMATLADYIAALPAEQKAAPALYEQRLQACRQCGHLQNGMCDWCGCFVEVRAAKAEQFCPDPQKKW